MIFLALLTLTRWPEFSIIVAVILGALFNFQTSKLVVFSAGGTFAKFFILYSALLVVNLAAVQVLQRVGLSPAWSQAFLSLPLGAASYIGQRLWVFSTPRAS